MMLPDRKTLIGMGLGAVCATALAAIGPGAVLGVIADEMPAGFDTGRLVKFEDRDYLVDYADWVSTDPISTYHINKIEAGRVSRVTITRTVTGTYSSDALTSRHVRYPGITVTDVTPRPLNAFLGWTGGKWQDFSGARGHSFVSLKRVQQVCAAGAPAC